MSSKTMTLPASSSPSAGSALLAREALGGFERFVGFEQGELLHEWRGTWLDPVDEVRHGTELYKVLRPLGWALRDAQRRSG